MLDENTEPAVVNLAHVGRAWQEAEYIGVDVELNGIL